MSMSLCLCFSAAGDALSVVDTGFARLGLTVCYDLRFPELYGRLCRPLPASTRASASDRASAGVSSPEARTTTASSSSGVAAGSKDVGVEVEGGLGAEVSVRIINRGRNYGRSYDFFVLDSFLL
jgi:hypothetical protein